MSNKNFALEAEVDRFGMHVRRHRLQNGLGVITLVDRQAPIVSYQTWYRVGSRHETPGQTGMAHFFEHLMFGGTAHHPAGTFDKAIEHCGGDVNAATWVDWTYYRDSVPSAKLSMVMELEADRMQHLVLDPDRVKAEREVVVQERIQRVDDDPDGFLDEELFRIAFEKHPYHWPTIGWMADIQSMPLDAILSFYRTHYSPNNATLVIVGDIDVDRCLDGIAEHYGAIPAQALPDHTPTPEPAQRGERRKQYEKPISAPRLLWGYRAPGQSDPDWITLSLLSGLLCGGPSARLYHHFVVDKEVATSIECGPMPFRDPSLFRMDVQLTADADPAAVAEDIDRQIENFIKNGVTARELEKIRSSAEVEFWMELETVDGKAETLGHFETTLGDFQSLYDHVERIPKVTADDLVRVAAEYLVNTQRTFLVAVPEADE
jgi:zinc protease